MIKKYSLLILVILISTITLNLSAQDKPMVLKGVSTSKCEQIIELYNLDNQRVKNVLRSVFQSFLTGYNFSHYQKTKKYKDLNLTSNYVFETIMKDCRRNRKEKVYWILVDFWENLNWGR